MCFFAAGFTAQTRPAMAQANAMGQGWYQRTGDRADYNQSRWDSDANSHRLSIQTGSPKSLIDQIPQDFMVARSVSTWMTSEIF